MPRLQLIPSADDNPNNNIVKEISKLPNVFDSFFCLFFVIFRREAYVSMCDDNLVKKQL